LASAITVAQDQDSIWVKAGAYPPIVLTNPVNGEYIDIKIIGGFAGTETSAAQSKPAINVTAIDGGGTARCVSSSGNTSATVLRGLRFVNGYDGDDLGGGALGLWDSNPTIVDCIFENNTAKYIAGAVMARGSCAPNFINCIFRYNGAMTTEGPYGGGAIFLPEGTLTATNCLFHDNKAGEGGAIWLGSDAQASFSNCTFAENDATIRRGGAVYDRAISSYRNCILWGNLPDQVYETRGATTVEFSDLQGGWAGTGNFNADPAFQSAGSNDFKLSAVSPCLDAGNTDGLPPDEGDLDWDGDTGEDVPKDLARKPRVYGGLLDIGAYEAQLVQQ
jgi:hypothetical protein